MFFRFKAAPLSFMLLLAVSQGAFGMKGTNMYSVDRMHAGTARSIFASETDYLDPDALKNSETLKLDGRRLETPIASHAAFLSRHAGSTGTTTLGGKKTAVAIISSAILPGTGELILYTSSKDIGTLVRAPIFVTLDVLFWYGYHHNHSEGKDIKQEYMDFADEHWSEDRFLVQHPCCLDEGECPTWQDYNYLGAIGYCSAETQDFFLYTPKEADEEEYYENIGKYNAFAYGWDDWAGQPDKWTPNRTYYWDLRKESDKYLLRGDQFVMLLIINRVVSVVDTAWLAYKIQKAEPKDDEGWSFELKPGIIAPTLTIGYRF